MNQIKRMFRNHLRERPFDFYVAFVLFFLGAWAIVDPYWPEDYVDGTILTLISIIGIYLMVSSAFVMSSLLCKRKRHPILALMGEMYGWFFISAASVALSIICLVALYQGVNNIYVWIVWIFLWAGMAISSGLRSCDLFNFYRSLKK